MKSIPDYKSIALQTVKLAKTTSKFLRVEWENFSTSNVETKGLHDFVSYVDKEAEKNLVEELKKIVPEAGFIVEEGTETKQGEHFNWIVDPLDGTTNFIHGLSPFAISIALMEGDEIVVGVVYEVSLDECFYAWNGSTAFLNGKQIKVSEAKAVKDSLIATGFPYYDYDRIQPMLKSLEYFMKNSHGIRRLGSAATDLAYVACGRFDAFYEYSLHAWDVAAGAFIVQQAGGKVSDFSKGSDYIFGSEIIATNAEVFDEFAGVVKELFA
ncbi:MAG: inositol monophosphatase [Bacteroidales bacterium]|nr:inositol monophosphatase [Bacteroidales bacterium]MCF8455095.1 inositol monophosphatase [Bacteroidales bacterium]